MLLKAMAKSVIGSVLNIRRSSDVDYANVALGTRIGRGVTVKEGCIIDSGTTIGSYTYVGWRTALTRASIGRFVSIANQVSIGPGEHAPDSPSTSSLFYSSPFKELTKQRSEIGNDVWVGVNSVVRRGVVVGNGAVIGANSFVNRDVAPFAIVAGSPARVLGFRFTEEQRHRIEDFGLVES